MNSSYRTEHGAVQLLLETAGMGRGLAGRADFHKKPRPRQHTMSSPVACWGSNPSATVPEVPRFRRRSKQCCFVTGQSQRERLEDFQGFSKDSWSHRVRGCSGNVPNSGFGITFKQNSSRHVTNASKFTIDYRNMAPFSSKISSFNTINLEFIVLSRFFTHGRRYIRRIPSGERRSPSVGSLSDG